MNDQNLIWEAYENSKNPWDNNFRLRQGVNLKGLSTSELLDYFDNLDVLLDEEAGGKKYYGYNNSSDPEEMEEPKIAEDKDLDIYFRNRFNFGLDELNMLPDIVSVRKDYNEYFDNITIDVWVGSIIKTATNIVEYDLNTGNFIEPDSDKYYDKDYDYNPYDR